MKEMKNVINDELLDAFKAGKVSKEGVQVRTNFRIHVQNVIDAIDILLDKERRQLTYGEIRNLKEIKTTFELVQEE